MRHFFFLWVAVFSLLGFVAVVSIFHMRPEEEVPVPEPQIEYIPESLSIVDFSSFAAGREGDYVSLFVVPSGSTNYMMDYTYQWYVFTPSRGYWIESSFSGNDTDELSFQMNYTRSTYLFCCVVSCQGYNYSAVTPVMNCHIIPNNSKGSGNIVLDYYEPWELEELDKDTLAAYEEKQKERES